MVLRLPTTRGELTSFQTTTRKLARMANHVLHEVLPHMLVEIRGQYVMAVIARGLARNGAPATVEECEKREENWQACRDQCKVLTDACDRLDDHLATVDHQASPASSPRKLQQELGLARGVYFQVRDFARYQMNREYEGVDHPPPYDPSTCRVFMKDLCAVEGSEGSEGADGPEMDGAHEWDELDQMLWLLAHAQDHNGWLNARARANGIEESRGL